MEKPDEELIRVGAHQLWEAAGKPEGRQDEFWHEAERELSREPAVNEESSATFTKWPGAGRPASLRRNAAFPVCGLRHLPG